MVNSSASSRASIFSTRSEEHTSELQSHLNLVCRLLLEKKKKTPCQEALQHAASLRPVSVPKRLPCAPAHTSTDMSRPQSVVTSSVFCIIIYARGSSLPFFFF